MSNNNKRPVFVPKHKRRRNETRKPYFHGAFTGGFSAGYYNTVGSKEGWKPSSMMDDDDDDDDRKKGETGTYNDGSNHITNDISQTGGTSSARKRRRNRQPQKIEDFMDEQDHNVWGGPTSVHQEYQTNQQQSMNVSSLGRDRDDGGDGDGNDERLSALLVVEPPSNVGHRLLRYLGWRNNSSTSTTTSSNGNGFASAAYVPAAVDDGRPPPHDFCQNNVDDDGGDPTFVIKKKRIRKIQLQQTRVQIPAPKFDLCGLGYSPHRDAPEFERYFEKRRKQARERAQLATTSTSTTDTLGGTRTRNGGSTDVYRVSHVLGNQGGVGIFNDTTATTNNDDGTRKGRRSDHANNIKEGAEDHNISYETIQDFVGTKSVGGFALRDDDDDVYDAESLHHKASLQNLDRDEYDTELYDHHDSEDDENQKDHHQHKDKAVIGNLLSAWASTDQQQDTDDKANTTALGGVTSDGRPPLLGFLLGGGISNNPGNRKELVRFKGPDVPLEYTVKRHEFAEDEYPDAFREISNSIQHRRTLEQKHTAANGPIVASTVVSTSNTNSLSLQQQRQKPLASSTFSGLAIAMKNRFTSSDDAPSKSTTAKHRGSASGPIGLHRPVVPCAKGDSNEKDSNTQTDSRGTPGKEREPPQKVVITRTVVTFYPDPLLSKRFGVKGFKRSNGRTNASDVSNKADSTESSFFDNEVMKSAAAAQAERKADTIVANHTPSNEELEQDTSINRPSLEKLKSIFESASESDDDDDDVDSIQGALSTEEFAAFPSATKRELMLTENENSASITDGHSKIENGANGESEALASSKTCEDDDADNRSKHHLSYHRRKSRSKRKSRYSTDSDTDSTSERRRRKRRKERSRKDGKKIRKKHKSSKRK